MEGRPSIRQAATVTVTLHDSFIHLHCMTYSFIQSGIRKDPMLAKAMPLLLVLLASCVTAAAEPPNFIIIFADDQGYGDLGSFGSETIKTPNIDRLAEEGRKFTSFMVASPVCTPSRAALLTGCYPKRVGMHQHVLFPTSKKGLNPSEHTIADHLKGQGYSTACFGKWHLGHQPEVLPTSNGFDTYLGIPYSNDMNHPDNKGKPKGGPDGMDILWNDPESTLTKWTTPLIKDEKIVELPVDQRTVTRRYTQAAIDFVETHQDKPFFVYLPHSMPHIPLYVPDDVRDPNPLNAYINVIEHIDHEVGRLLDTLDRLKLTENTYVIYTTDNGPWLPFKHHGGSAGVLRDGKGTTFEGGQRVPCLIRGPGIPAGTYANNSRGPLTYCLPSQQSLRHRYRVIIRSMVWMSQIFGWERQPNLFERSSFTTPLKGNSRDYGKGIGNYS